MDVAALTSVSSASAVSQLADLSAVRSTRTLTPSQLRNASPEVQRKQVAQQFEAILVRQLLGKTMTSMVGQGDDATSSVFGDMLTDSFSQQITHAGGLGLASLLEKQLTPPAERTGPLSATPTAATTTANVSASPAVHS